MQAHDTVYDGAQDKVQKLLDFCDVPQIKQEIMEYMGFSSKRQFNERYMKPLLESGELVMTVPDKPKSKNRKYVKS